MIAPRSPLLLSRVVEHYHRTFCERKDAQAYLTKRGLTDADVLKAFKVGYADGSLLKTLPVSRCPLPEGRAKATRETANGQRATSGPDIREELIRLGVLTKEGRELLGGCVVVPIPDPLSGEWTTLYGRGMRTPRHCYLTGPLRGVLNFQAARSGDEVILTESVIDALSFHQVGIGTAIPIYGTNGFTGDHLDLLKREGVRRVILALDGDAAGRKATAALKEKLASLGIGVRVMPYPQGVKDPNEMLVSCNGTARAVFAKMLEEAEPRAAATSVSVPACVGARLACTCAAGAPARETDGGRPPHDGGRQAAPLPAVGGAVARDGEMLTFRRDGLAYSARAFAPLLGRLRATVKVERALPAGRQGSVFHVDTIDLYASRSRAEFGKRAAKALGVDADTVERDLLALLVEAEKTASEASDVEASGTPPPISESERAEALALLRRPDLLDQVARDVDALGFVGEETNKRLLYLVAISRKLPDPLSAIVLSQSGAGKSGLTEVIEKLTPPEDVVLLTRLTPQSLYYTEPGFLDKKLVIVEERYGSMEADYSIRVLQSRKKLIAAAPIKDPQTGNMRTKVFTVEARAAFIEATTASAVNHENATRCFELMMDESPEQTRRIHERMSLLQTERGLALRLEADAIARRHWNAQRLLEPSPVVIPFADKLTFPSAWLRTRRDYARFLNLIGVSAFLHQHQRERKKGAIVADIADYAVAYNLAASVLAETLGDVKRPLREAYERIRGLCEEGNGSVSRCEIREALGVPDSTVRGWLSQLVELEYLKSDASKGGAGKVTRYRLTDRGPRHEIVVGLLVPEELRQVVEGRR
jgi:DNA-binding transcriptional ArsR family regulator